MARLWMLSAVLAAVAGVAFASEVVQLTADNFEHDTQVATGSTTGNWFVMFHAPWCGHCKRLKPTWEELAEELKGEVNVASVDVPANRALGSRFRIKGFPTLLYFSHGKMYKFSGSRKLETLKDYALGGFKKMEAEPVPSTPSMFDEVRETVTGVVDDALRDIKKGKYTSPRVLILALPIVFLLFTFIVIFAVPDPPRRPAVAATGTAEGKSD
mmetsp:Transcript_12361/g.41814  ORF Transcript_12361/g.41814 Transcript_12361/m.41814 type:complete len:213 (-) Transcript_12361:31-669(-)